MWLLLSAVFAVWCACSSSVEPTAELSAIPRAINDTGQVSVLTAKVIDKAGKPGTGRVVFKAPAGTLKTAVSVPLGATGEASVDFSCVAATDPGCVGSLRVTVEWTSGTEFASSFLNVQVGEVASGAGGSSGSGGGGGGNPGPGVYKPTAECKNNPIRPGLPPTCCIKAFPAPQCGSVVLSDGAGVSLTFREASGLQAIPNGATRLIRVAASTAPIPDIDGGCDGAKFGLVAATEGISLGIALYSDGSIDDTGVWTSFQSGGALAFNGVHPSLCARWADGKTKALYATFRQIGAVGEDGGDWVSDPPSGEPISVNVLLQK
jgi:hypothetical protein